MDDVSRRMGPATLWTSDVDDGALCSFNDVQYKEHHTADLSTDAHRK